MNRHLVCDFSEEPPKSFGDVGGIENLSLDGCSKWVTDEIVESLSVGGKLETVSLFRCWRITNRSVFNLMKTNGSSIKRLSLAGCTNISDKAMFYVSRFSMAGIESLDITRCPRISDVGINYLSASRVLAESLKSLRLYADSQLGPSSHIAISVFSNLEELDLCGHADLSDHNLLAILKKCSNLRYLNLSWCTSLTTIVVREIIDNNLLPKIESLSLFGDQAISNAADLVQYLNDSGTAIRELDIRGIPAAMQLTAHDCEGLRKSLPSIENWKLHT